jgi:hypothetical protein
MATGPAAKNKIRKWGGGEEIKVGERCCNARYIFASNILKAKTADTPCNCVKKLKPQIKQELDPFRSVSFCTCIP